MEVRNVGFGFHYTVRESDYARSSSASYDHVESSADQSQLPLPPPILRNENESSNHVLTCTLCCEVPTDPVIAPICQHIFCRTCIRQALQLRSECPNDRQSLHFSDVKRLDGALRRIWEVVPVRCPKENCSWTGTMGAYEAHSRQCSAGNSAAIQEFGRRIEELKAALNDKIMRLTERLAAKDGELQQVREELVSCKKQVSELTEQNDKLRTEAAMYAVNGNYAYNRHNIVKLTQLICHSLENKPWSIDSNRIYNCVKDIHDDLDRGYNDNPPHMSIDVRMLLSVCLASTWFSDRQADNILRWLSAMR